MATAAYMNAPRVKKPTAPTQPKPAQPAQPMVNSKNGSGGIGGQQAQSAQPMSVNSRDGSGNSQPGQMGSMGGGLAASQSNYAKMQAGMGQRSPMAANSGTSSTQRGPDRFGGTAQQGQQFAAQVQQQQGMYNNAAPSGGGTWGNAGGNPTNARDGSGNAAANPWQPPNMGRQQQDMQGMHNNAMAFAANQPSAQGGGGQWGNQGGAQGQQANGRGPFQMTPQNSPDMFRPQGGVQMAPDGINTINAGGGMTRMGSVNPPSPGVPGTLSQQQSLHNQFPAPPTQQPGQTGQGGSNPMPSWNPNFTPYQPPTPAPGAADPVGGSAGFFGGLNNVWDPNHYMGENQDAENYLANTLPVAQFDQNKYQYWNDSNNAMYQFNANHGLAANQNNFQQSLSTQQQLMAEWQAKQQANQFQQQFGHTVQMDQAGLVLSQKELEQQGVLNQGQIDRWGGQTANEATRNANDLHIANETNRIDEMYKNNMISLEQRNLALQELTQQQGNQLSYDTLDHQAQQNQFDRENMLSIANTQAYGRSAAPQMNWSRAWN